MAVSLEKLNERLMTTRVFDIYLIYIKGANARHVIITPTHKGEMAFLTGNLVGEAQNITYQGETYENHWSISINHFYCCNPFGLQRNGQRPK
jgi:hypothetical protein